MKDRSVTREAGARPFWSSLTEAERLALASSGELRDFPAGELLCCEGEPARHVIVVLSGWTKVCLTEDGKERIIAFRGSGDLVGERAALLVRQRSATVVALDTVKALLVPSVEFALFLDEHPRGLALLEDQLYGRLTENAPGAGALEERIARFLTELVVPRTGPDGPPTIPVTLRELADWLEAPVAEVERILATWERGGIARCLERGVTILDVAGFRRLGTEGGAVAARYEWSGQNCSVMLTDVSAFGGGGRNDRDRRAVRDALYRILRGAFADAGLTWDRCYREDRGDGVLLIIPPAVPTSALVEPLLPQLAAGLDAHDRVASEGKRLQLRVALHVGPVVPDAEGVSGEAIIQAARLLDARLFKDQIARTGVDLGFIASTFVFDNVVRHTVDPGHYVQIEVAEKETVTTAWMCLFHGTRSLTPSTGPRSGLPEVAPGRRTRPVFGDVTVEGDLVMGDKIQYGR